ncbi:hypothetical protein CEXT_546821 [Caerostris extrusa]|uniref:Uncharacterized protein n=1 Tax=Caerostris extrusa TaxID=172846 RepID=A0AAV4Y7Q6_CAEEX|nr:hypothetical protein CEXT_546821 [Caerostris extrusa]
MDSRLSQDLHAIRLCPGTLPVHACVKALNSVPASTWKVKVTVVPHVKGLTALGLASWHHGFCLLAVPWSYTVRNHFAGFMTHVNRTQQTFSSPVQLQPLGTVMGVIVTFFSDLSI